MKTVNVTYLEEVCGGSEEVIKEMVDIFLEQVPEFYNEMQGLLREKRYHDLGMMAHKAKSSVAIMGMDHLAHKLKELELSAKAEERVDEYDSFLAEFKAETDKAIAELEVYLNNM